MQKWLKIFKIKMMQGDRNQRLIGWRSGLLLAMLGILSAQPFDDRWLDAEIAAKSAGLAASRAMCARRSDSGASRLDVTYYGLWLRPDPTNQSLTGRTIIGFRALESGLQTVRFNLVDNLNVDSVSVNVQTYSHQSGYLILDLAQPLDSGQVCDVTIAYHGLPQSTGLGAFMFGTSNDSPVIATLSQPYYAHYWFPCRDVPADKADSADIRITVPPALTAVSNGLLVALTTDADGWRTFHWKTRYPIAAYLISIAVAEYTHWRDIYPVAEGDSLPVDYWVLPQSVSGAQQNLAKTPQMIQFFSSIWGAYPFLNEKYGQAQFLWGGGMEHQTCTSLGSFSELLICHELAHQWWGDMVTCRTWNDIWLNEGFARYSEALWYEHLNGAQGLRSYMDYINRPVYWRPGSLYVIDTTQTSQIFNRIVYDKGAWVLHMLRKLVGEPQFLAFFSEYRSRYAMQTVTTAAMQDVMETVSGLQLEWFFEQWVYGSGMPVYQVAWQRTRTGARNWQVQLTIHQTQTTPTLFKMPLEIRVHTAVGQTTETIWDSLATQSFVIQCSDMPLTVTVDPDGWVLKSLDYLTIDPDLGTQPQQFYLSNPYPNPFNARTSFYLYAPQDMQGVLRVLDINGREVALLQRGLLRAGFHPMEWQAGEAASGSYFIRFESDAITRHKQVILIK